MKSNWKPAVALAMLSIVAACNQPEPPRTAGDFCLSDKPISVNVAPVEGQDDPGNAFDSEPTVLQVLSHNAVYHGVCG